MEKLHVPVSSDLSRPLRQRQNLNWAPKQCASVPDTHDQSDQAGSGEPACFAPRMTTRNPSTRLHRYQSNYREARALLQQITCALEENSRFESIPPNGRFSKTRSSPYPTRHYQRCPDRQIFCPVKATEMECRGRNSRHSTSFGAPINRESFTLVVGRSRTSSSFPHLA